MPHCAQQQLGGVQRVVGVRRLQTEGTERKVDRLRRPILSRGEGRQAAPGGGVRRIDPGGAGEQVGGVLVPPGGLQQTAGVEGRFERARIKLAGAQAVKNCPIHLAVGGKGAARMAMPGGPESVGLSSRS